MRTKTEFRAQGLRAISRRDGPLVRVELLIPYIQRFRRENEIAQDGKRSNHDGKRTGEDDLVGKTHARRIRMILAGKQEFMGLYNVDTFMHVLGFGSHTFQTDAALEAAFATPDEEVFAHDGR